MKVAGLQQHLEDLAKLLAASGAKEVSSDLEAIQKGLQPYREQTLKAFAAFLLEANKPAALEPSRPAPRATTVPKASSDPQNVATEIKHLWENGTTVSYAEIDAGLAKLSEIGKPGLLTVATAIGLKGMSGKKVGEIRSSITNRVRGVKGIDDRSKMHEYPGRQAERLPDDAGTVADLRA